MKGIEKFENLKPNTLITKLLLKIEQDLPLFVKSDSFKNILVRKHNENQHSEAFVHFLLTRPIAETFTFMRETSQKGSSTVDISVRLYTGEIVFTIEAKVLPTPVYKGSTEYQYVYNNTNGGGIERFKNGKHGLDDSDSFIDVNGMIAFIKENDFTHWHSKVNQWILDASWGVSEQLDKTYFTTIGKLVSSHKRIDGKKLTLHHFWVTV